MNDSTDLFASEGTSTDAGSPVKAHGARLLSLVGTPSPKLHAVLSIVRALAKVTLEEFEVISANTLMDLKTNLHFLPGIRRSVILYADYPQPDIVSMLVGVEAPVAICADDFVTLAHYSVVWREYGGVDAARFASMGLVNIEPLITTPPPTSLIINDGEVQLAELVSKLANLYGIPASASTIGEVLTDLGETGRDDVTLSAFATRTTAGFAHAREILERRSPLENELLDSLAGQYNGIAAGHKIESLEWPPFALLRPDYPDRLTVGAIDLTGPARFIYYGPYFALPAGAWRANIAIEVRDCLSDNQVAFDVISGEILAVVRAKLPPQGVFSCEIYFQITDSSKPLEIRVQLMTGAIEGVIVLRQIMLYPIASSDEDDYS